MNHLPYSEACERNKQPILEVLGRLLPRQGVVLEVGSCTGQHVVYFADSLTGLRWQPSDQADYLDGLNLRLAAEGSDNILAPIELDVTATWPDAQYEAVFSANTAHIMHWPMVCDMFAGVGRCLKPGGVFILYGPFNQDGQYTSASNEAFDRSLRSRDPGMGIRDVSDLATLAQSHQLVLEDDFAMPANNQVLLFRRNDALDSESDTESHPG